MRKTALGNTGLQVSVLGYGGGPIGYLKADKDQAARVLNLLLDHGVNLIDTAACYYASEELIGSALGHRRAECVLVTKCGHALDDLPGEEWSDGLIAATVDRALRRLQTDHIDVMLLHSCSLPVLQEGTALAALVKAREAGKVRFLGYSGDNEAAVYAASLPEIAVIETSINICDQANLATVVPAAQKRKLGVIAKRPIANAAWKAASQQRGIYANYAQPYAERLQQMHLTPQELGFDGAPDVVWPEIALRFTLCQAGVHSAIIGTTNPDNALVNVRTAENGPLPTAALDKVRTAFRAAAKSAKEEWAGLS